jgi:hypothetical protein
MSLAYIAYRIASDSTFAEQVQASQDLGTIDELRFLPQEDLDALESFITGNLLQSLKELRFEAGDGLEPEPWWIP